LGISVDYLQVIIIRQIAFSPFIRVDPNVRLIGDTAGRQVLFNSVVNSISSLLGRKRKVACPLNILLIRLHSEL
jgi:hypothetical protein